MRVGLITLISILMLTGPQLTAPPPAPDLAVVASVPATVTTGSNQQLATAVTEVISPTMLQMDPVVETTEPATTATPSPIVQAEPVPVLMYHELGDGPNELYLAIDDFEAQLDYLQLEGYQTVSLRQLYDHRIHGKPLPDKPIALTFDDGYLSVYTEALPRLVQRDMVATLFIESAHVGWQNRLDWPHLQELVEAGFEIGSHTQTHPDLTYLDHDQLLDEVQGSKITLEQRLNITVDFFCYPAGQYDRSVITAVKESGYLAAVTTQYGSVAADDDPYLWPRIRISRSDHADGLLYKLEP